MTTDLSSWADSGHDRCFKLQNRALTGWYFGKYNRAQLAVTKTPSSTIWWYTTSDALTLLPVGGKTLSEKKADALLTWVLSGYNLGRINSSCQQPCHTPFAWSCSWSPTVIPDVQAALYFAATSSIASLTPLSRLNKGASAALYSLIFFCRGKAAQFLWATTNATWCCLCWTTSCSLDIA